MLNEKTSTDQFVRRRLEEAGLRYEEQGSSFPPIAQALKHASKTGTERGMPEFIIIYNSTNANVPNLPVIIENKLSNDFLIDSHGKMSLETGPNSPVSKYAVNGAVHYAKHIIEKSDFKEVIAIGVTGNERDHNIQPVFVSETEIRILEKVDTFENFKIENISNYYLHTIKKIKSTEEVLSEDLIKVAKELHEDLRNYGQLKEEEKPLVVSGLLLALEQGSDLEELEISDLTGKKSDWNQDGVKIYDKIHNFVNASDIQPDRKKQMLMTQFRFLKERTLLNTVNPNLVDEDNLLGMTPLKYFALKIKNKVQNKMKSLTYYDILGKFYSEFISYSAGDGKGLGIVITPPHITKLFCELLNLNTDDIVLDTCTGTGGFLVAAMMHMVEKAKDDKEKISNIKRNQLHGIEMREDLYTIATTNMILRGDGKSNLLCNDYLKVNSDEYKLMKATVGMINPPYSQSKNSDTRHLSELNFIVGLLDRLEVGGRTAAIVPQSVMVGKTKYDKDLKKKLLKKHTVESVITMPNELFYPVGTHTVIVIMTAHIPHLPQKRVKFINYSDDGYKKHKTLGRIASETARDKEKYLLNAFFDREDVPNSFMVKAEITPNDEWLHSFFYFNDTIPTDEMFEKTVQDYLAFKLDQIVHGKGYLFDDEVKSSKK